MKIKLHTKQTGSKSTKHHNKRKLEYKTAAKHVIQDWEMSPLEALKVNYLDHS